MKGKTHVVIGLMTLYALNPELELEKMNLLFTTGVVLGSLLPDSDIKHAPMGKIAPLHWFFKHRQEVHSFFSMFIATTICGFFNIMFGLGVGFGFGLHLLTDNLTPMGLPKALWFPFRKK